MNPENKRKLIIGMIALDLLVAIGLALYFFTQPAKSTEFDAQRAYQDVLAQVEFGPRIPGSQAHNDTVEYIRAELEQAGWKVSILETEYQGKSIRNIVTTRSKNDPEILLGAHYDSRLLADNDPDPANHEKPVPGANDGASGVAILLEIARVLPDDSIPVALAFFDAEDNGEISGWDWILGSRAFAQNMTFTPKAMILVDMVGDADLNIYQERGSNKELTSQIWEQAKSLGYESAFIPEYRYWVIDDHVPFLEKGIPSVDIIDLDYPYWHTIADTPDKVAPESLKMVGDTLLHWLAAQKLQE